MIKGEKVYVTNDFRETQRLGKAFIEIALRSRLGQSPTLSQEEAGAVVIALYGELGSGKTTFVQGLAKGFGITRRIISPTFIIVRTYILQVQNSKLKSLERFYHIDLYRIVTEKDIQGLGIEEIIKDPKGIVAIEWAEKMWGLLPKRRWDVRFEYVDQNKRRITIKKFQPQNSKSETISKFK